LKIASSHLDSLGVDKFDLKEMADRDAKSNLTVFETLRWQHYPFLYNGLLYKLPDWDRLIEIIADDLETKASSWGGSIYTRDMPRVLGLRAFLKKHGKC